MEIANPVRDVALKGFAQRLLRLFAIMLLLGGTVGVHATVRQPNGEYQDAMDDLSVKLWTQWHVRCA